MTYIIILLAAAIAVYAQLPQRVTIPIAIEAPDLRDGAQQVVIRWYNDAIQGTSYGSEETSIVIQQGYANLVLGSASPLPSELLERGSAWISVQFAGYPEPAVRYAVLPNAFAHTSGFALVAASLDPRATGLVTSLNEIAGAVELRAGNSLAIARTGRTLTLTTDFPFEEGTVAGNGQRWEFEIRLQDRRLLGRPMVCSIDGTQDLIAVTCYYDAITEKYHIISSAILQSNETLRWHVGHR